MVLVCLRSWKGIETCIFKEVDDVNQKGEKLNSCDWTTRSLALENFRIELNGSPLSSPFLLSWCPCKSHEFTYLLGQRIFSTKM